MVMYVRNCLAFLFALRAFYTEQSVMCHPVYGEIFCYLLGT